MNVARLHDDGVVGIGTDSSLYGRVSVGAPWKRIENTCCVVAVASQLSDGSLVGVGKDNLLYRRAQGNRLGRHVDYANPWERMP